MLIAYRYALFLPIAIIEGPIATMIAGFLASLGFLNFALVFTIAVLGDIIGDLIYYHVGRFGTLIAPDRHRFFVVTRDQLEHLRLYLNKHPAKAFLFGKWTHAIGGAILLAGGMAKVPIKIFLWWNFVGTLPKVMVFLVVGYFFGRAYQKIDEYLGYAALSILIITVLGAVSYLLIWALRRRIHIDDL